MRNRQETSQKFSIKKFKFGAASVLIGVVFASFTGTAQADTETVSSGETLNVQSEASQSVEASTQALDSSQSDSVVTSIEVESTTTVQVETTTSEAVEKESTIDTSVSPTIVSNPASENTTPTMTTVEETASASQGNYAVTNKVVYLDAGHGGVDPGAVYNGTKEADLTLSIYQLVKNQLEDAGYVVESSRTSAASVGLLERSADANDTNSDIFVSIHINASATPSTAGVETYWYAPDSNYPSQMNSRYHVDVERLKRSAYLAESIQAATVSKTGANDRGVQRETFAVLRETTAPAVLVEVGYLSNPSERAKLVTDSYQQEVASAIVEGILNYYQNYNQGGQAATSSKNVSNSSTSNVTNTTPTKVPSSSLSSSGTYEFKTRTGVKNEAKLSSEDLAYYEVGQTVNYDKVVSSEGYNWLSYVSYSGNRRYVPVEKVSSSSTSPSTATTPSSSTTPVKTDSAKVETSQSATSNLSSSGTYEFKTRTGVKNEAKLSSEDLAYYEVGQTVNYDKVVSSEGYNWLSYVSYSGNRRYVPVEKVSSSSTSPSTATTPSSSTTPVKTDSAKVETSQSAASNLSSSGTYEFKTRTGVKNEAKLSSEDLAYYEVGQTVNYDKVVSSEGYNWLSYVSYSGNRRYVPVEKVSSSSTTPSTATTPSSSTTPVKTDSAKIETSQSAASNLSSSGTYEFKTRTGVKNEAKLSSDNLAYYEVGQTVNYDKVVSSEGYNWLSYVSYSGNRRYVPVEKVSSSSTTPSAATTPSSTTPVKTDSAKVETSQSAASNLSSSGTYEFKTRTGVKNEAKLSSEDLAYYEVGQTVNYDKVVSSEGYNWLSYVSYSGNRRYVPVEKVSSSSTTPSAATTPSSSTTPVKTDSTKVETSQSAASNLSSSGTYEFKTRTAVKNEAKLSSDNLAYYEVGQTVNYDKVVSSEGYNWLSYVSYSGNRRYVPVEKIEEKTSVATSSTSSNTLPETNAAAEIKETVKAENGYTTRIRYQGTGVYKVSIDNIDARKGTVKMAVWSEENSQDDIRWYDLTTTNTTAEAKFDVTNHVGTGRYQIHLYQNEAGTMNFLSAVSQEVKRNNFDAPYYSQRDARWANKQYGLSNMDATGCVPTVLSMVFSGLTGEDIKPTTVADYLYKETVAFNKLELGTDATGIILAAEKWNMDATPLKTQADIEEALKEGHYVLAAVQGSPFVRVYGSLSHELLLAGYDNGKTYVRDPYTPSLNGWHSLSNIFTQQSKFASDIVGIGKPFVKITDRL
ncbi:SH3 domain-containing protein [Streptococcus sp. sy018]|uniref:SH3 domain-containing protein n=1 Tax=Streptococcus sp. sy018 TaxID=2600147 RepID=UPI0011B72E66|nr:SH3 domain-containing protein [Streptococcus sp. sy018]TWS94213.1 YSIRK-type signal peptide-containing protein [Streptococcus sp. sy018]